MTVYATQSDVEKAISPAMLIAIADHNADGVADVDVIARALSEASSLADTYLAAHLPIGTVPDVLRRAVVDIASELMRARDQSTEDSRRRYDAALAWLKDVASGDAVFGPGASVTEPGDPEVDTDSPPRLFTRETGSRFL